MRSVKASDLKPGDVIRHCPNEPGLEGWTVVELRRAGWWISHNPEEWDPCVLLKLRHRTYASLMGGETFFDETRSAWLEADEEVET